MNELINWMARHNTLMIQSGFTIVLILSVVYVYRLFFSSQSDGQSAEDLTGLNEKLAQLIQQQTRGVSAAGRVEVGGDTSQVAAVQSSVEVEALQKEITQLKEQLHVAEKKIFELTPTDGSAPAVDASSAGTASTKSVSSPESEVQTSALKAKVQELEARLSEYDIIADDIAELSQLRADYAVLKKKNEELMAQVASGGAAVNSSEPTPTAAPVAPETSPEMTTEITPEAQPAAAPDISSTAPETAPQTEEKSDASILESVLGGLDLGVAPSTEQVVESFENQQQNTSDLVAATQAVSDASEQETQVASVNASENSIEPDIAVNAVISESDKNLMAEFEKTTRKA